VKHFVMLTNLTDEGRKTIKDSPERIQSVNKAVEAWGAKIIGQYVLMGPYDFVTILEAEDELAVLKIAMELGSRGSMQTITLPAFPVDALIRKLK
jgi:uncharacterized protein with GYD domain